MGTLILAKLSISFPLLLTNAVLIVKFDEDLKWTLSYHCTLIEVDQCHVLDATPRQFNCSSDVIELLHCLQACQVCCGKRYVTSSSL